MTIRPGRNLVRTAARRTPGAVALLFVCPRPLAVASALVSPRVARRLRRSLAANGLRRIVVSTRAAAGRRARCAVRGRTALRQPRAGAAFAAALREVAPAAALPRMVDRRFPAAGITQFDRFPPIVPDPASAGGSNSGRRGSG